MRKRNKQPAVDPRLEMKKSIVQEVREFMNMGKVKKIVGMGTEVFGAISPLLEKPTWWNAAKAAFAVGKVIVDDVEIWSDDYFCGDEWSLPYSRDFNQTILKAIAGYPYTTIRTSDDTNVIKLVNVNGIKAGYTLNTRINTVDNIYVETQHIERAREIIKKLLWDMFQDANLVMRQNKRLGSFVDGEDSRVVFEPDDIFECMSSARATEYSTYLKRCIEAGVPRSVMLYGPPGTGKSTMARTIVNTLNMRSFRIRVEDVSGIESSTLFEAINIFQPDAVILDDFDRANAQAQLLETLEFFQRHVKLVIATVNDRNSLDEAILRPGRFDELIFIKQMDPDVVKAVLGDELQDAFETVKDWPIAFIQEYAKRRRFMTAEEAAKSTAELAARVKRLEKYEDVDDVERMHRLLKSVKGSKHLGSDALKFFDDVDESDEDEKDLLLEHDA